MLSFSKIIPAGRFTLEVAFDRLRKAALGLLSIAAKAFASLRTASPTATRVLVVLTSLILAASLLTVETTHTNIRTPVVIIRIPIVRFLVISLLLI